MESFGNRNSNSGGVMLGQDADKAGFYVNASGAVVPVPSLTAAGVEVLPAPATAAQTAKVFDNSVAGWKPFIEYLFKSDGIEPTDQDYKVLGTYLTNTFLVGKAPTGRPAGLTAGGRVEEFYNDNHVESGPNGGQFAPGPSGGAGGGGGGSVPPPPAALPPAGWNPDPTGRHTHRYWDGSRWTEHVADNGVSGVDADLSVKPVEASIPAPPAAVVTEAHATVGDYLKGTLKHPFTPIWKLPGKVEAEKAAASAPSPAAADTPAAAPAGESRADYLARVNSTSTPVGSGKKPGFFSAEAQANRVAKIQAAQAAKTHDIAMGGGISANDQRRLEKEAKIASRSIFNPLHRSKARTERAQNRAEALGEKINGQQNAAMIALMQENARLKAGQ